MKKIIIIALSGLVMSCNGFMGDGFEINGEVKGLADGTRVFLQKQDDKQATITIDTAKLEKGKFTFEGEAKEPQMHSISFENLQGGFGVIVEKGTIKAVVNKDSLYNTKLSGTYNNDEFAKFNVRALDMQKKIREFEQKNIPLMQKAQQQNDTVVINKLRKEYGQFQISFVNDNEKYIQENPKSFFAVLLVEGMLGDMQPKLDKIKKFYDGLDPEIKKTKPGLNIKAKLEEINSVTVGRKAPDFSAPNPDGKSVSLKESLGKVTIIDFWASWCGPCRAENPSVVALYNEFHAKGLNIIGVSLDRTGEAAKWKEAIAKDKLAWTQVSNLKFWEDPIALKYNVKSIPATFLLDSSGKIVARDLRGAELKAKVAELLAK